MKERTTAIKSVLRFLDMARWKKIPCSPDQVVRHRISALALAVALVILTLACGTDDGAPSLTFEECLRRDYVGLAPGDSTWGIDIPELDVGEGTLEQRVLQSDLVVLARVLDVEVEAVDIEGVESKLKQPSLYGDIEYTLLVIVFLKVREYLKGEGPDRMTAIVESQYVFDSMEKESCARVVLSEQFGQLIDSDQGIAFLEATEDPNFYHMGYAHENFVKPYKQYVDHSTWLPGEHDPVGEDWIFYDRRGVSSPDERNPEEWVSLAEVRQRAYSVIEEYNRSARRSCVYSKYFYMGRDPWDYRGLLWHHEDYRDHHIIFNGENVPVRAGTMVWNYPDYYDHSRKLHMSLDGRDANSFEVTYQTGYEHTFNEWLAASGGSGFRLAIWYKPHEGRVERWQQKISGHVITAIEELGEGEYEFNLHIENRSEDFVDCGQGLREPGKFRVIVDPDRATTPPAPANVQVSQSDQEGWMISWDPVEGTDTYWVKVYRMSGGVEKIDQWLATHTRDSHYRIKSSDMKGCGDVIYIEIWPRGDGSTYLRDFGENSGPTQIQNAPCAQ